MARNKLRADKRPTSLQVSGREVQLYWGRDSMPEDSMQDFGHTEPEDRRIRINTERCGTEVGVESTLLHELIHVSLASAGLDNFLGDKLDEAVATCLENGLYPVIVDLVEKGYFRRKPIEPKESK